MKEKIISLLKGSLILTISNICIKAINFFLLPLYTEYLTPEQLGTSDTITTFTSLILPILVLGLDSAYSAFYFDEESREYKKSVFSSIFFILAITSIIPIVGTFFSKQLSLLLFGNVKCDWIITISLLTICCNLWYLPFSLYLRLENRMTAFAIVNFTSSTLMIVSNIITVSILQIGEAALIVSTLLANISMLCLYIFTARYYPKLSTFNADLSKKMLKYSIPLVPMVVSSWILTTSDRLILLEALDEASVGLYGISSRFVSIINVVTNSIYMAYTTFAFSSKNEPNSKAIYAKTLDVLNLCLTIAVFGISIFSIEILSIMVNEQYLSSYIVLPGLLFAQLLYASNTIVSYGLSFEKKSGQLLLTVTVAALLNLGLNICFIPKFGLIAAALTTWVGYCAMLMITYKLSQKVYECPYKIKRVIVFNFAMLLIAMISVEYVPFCGRLAIFVLTIGVFLLVYRDTVTLLCDCIKNLGVKK